MSRVMTNVYSDVDLSNDGETLPKKKNSTQIIDASPY